MTIDVKVIADSVFAARSPDYFRLTTMAVTYPRFIHSEFMTHRAFARNASSSRAIPATRMIRNIMQDMAEPVEWGSNKPGMQAGQELSGFHRAAAKTLWRGAGYMACGTSYVLHKLGAHKQIVNRVTEPWSHITVLVSATNWANFFALRDHPDADPTIQALARAMKNARKNSIPEKLEWGQWHLPYITDEDRWLDEYTLRKVSAARCARVSYLTHENKRPKLTDDIKLFERLALHSPVHASPLEHQATPDNYYGWTINTDTDRAEYRWDFAHQHGPFVGWRQFRKMIENEAVMDDRSSIWF